MPARRRAPCGCGSQALTLWSWQSLCHRLLARVLARMVLGGPGRRSKVATFVLFQALRGTPIRRGVIVRQRMRQRGFQIPDEQFLPSGSLPDFVRALLEAHLDAQFSSIGSRAASIRAAFFRRNISSAISRNSGFIRSSSYDAPRQGRGHAAAGSPPNGSCQRRQSQGAARCGCDLWNGPCEAQWRSGLRAAAEGPVQQFQGRA